MKYTASYSTCKYITTFALLLTFLRSNVPYRRLSIFKLFEQTHPLKRKDIKFSDFLIGKVSTKGVNLSPGVFNTLLTRHALSKESYYVKYVCIT